MNLTVLKYNKANSICQLRVEVGVHKEKHTTRRGHTELESIFKAVEIPQK